MARQPLRRAEVVVGFQKMCGDQMAQRKATDPFGHLGHHDRRPDGLPGKMLVMGPGIVFRSRDLVGELGRLKKLQTKSVLFHLTSLNTGPLSAISNQGADTFTGNHASGAFSGFIDIIGHKRPGTL